jgi:hypothetical protein
MSCGGPLYILSTLRTAALVCRGTTVGNHCPRISGPNLFEFAHPQVETCVPPERFLKVHKNSIFHTS